MYLGRTPTCRPTRTWPARRPGSAPCWTPAAPTSSYVYLPPGPDGAKVGLDDWLAAMATKSAGCSPLADDQPPARPAKAPRGPAGRHGPRCRSGRPGRAAGELRDWLASYVAFPSAHHAVAVTLWIAHTHLADRFDSTGRLVLFPRTRMRQDPRAGARRATCAGAEMLNDASAAYLFRRIGTGAPAGHAAAGRRRRDLEARQGRRERRAVRSIVNAGHHKGAAVGRVEINSRGAELIRFQVYAPAALAAKGDPLPDTSCPAPIVVRMRRRPPGTSPCAATGSGSPAPKARRCAASLTAWAASVAGKVGNPGRTYRRRRPTGPPTCGSR